MKEVKLLDRVQAGLYFSFSSILATIQEHCLKSELALNYYHDSSLLHDLMVLTKNMKV